MNRSTSCKSSSSPWVMLHGTRNKHNTSTRTRVESNQSLDSLRKSICVCGVVGNTSLPSSTRSSINVRRSIQGLFALSVNDRLLDTERGTIHPSLTALPGYVLDAFQNRTARHYRLQFHSTVKCLLIILWSPCWLGVGRVAKSMLGLLLYSP